MAPKGAYLAASTDRTAYLAREEREMRDAALASSTMEEDTFAIFESYGLGRERVGPLVEGLKEDPDMWVKVRTHQTMMLQLGGIDLTIQLSS